MPEDLLIEPEFEFEFEFELGNEEGLKDWAIKDQRGPRRTLLALLSRRGPLIEHERDNDNDRSN